MNECEAIKRGGTLNARDNPYLCEIYAARHSPEHAKECLAYWKRLSRAAITKDWKRDCKDNAANWLAIITQQERIR